MLKQSRKVGLCEAGSSISPGPWQLNAKGTLEDACLPVYSAKKTEFHLVSDVLQDLPRLFDPWSLQVEPLYKARSSKRRIDRCKGNHVPHKSLRASQLTQLPHLGHDIPSNSFVDQNQRGCSEMLLEEKCSRNPPRKVSGWRKTTYEVPGFWALSLQRQKTCSR